MGAIKLFDRVILNADYKTNNKIYKTGLIGTVRAFIESNDVALVQYGYADSPQYVGLSCSLLIHATGKDLIRVNPKNLTIPLYHIGTMFAIRDGINEELEHDYKTGVIKSVRLAINEALDTVEIEFKDESTKKYSRQFMEEFASMIPCELPEFNDSDPYYRIIPKSVEDKTPYPICYPGMKQQGDKEDLIDRDTPEIVPSNTADDEVITLTIDGFDFEVQNSTVLLPTMVDKDDIPKLLKALQRIENLIKT